MEKDLIEKQVIYDGNRIRLEVHHFMSNSGNRMKKEICVHPGAVVILPMLNEQTILLIRNYRYSIRETLLELPAGTLEKNEDPINCAGRELVEETGYLAHRMERMLDFYASPGVLTEKMYTFAAYNLEKVGQDLEEDENIEVVPTRFDDAIDLIKNRQIVDGKTIAILLAYDRFFRKQK